MFKTPNLGLSVRYPVADLERGLAETANAEDAIVDLNFALIDAAHTSGGGGGGGATMNSWFNGFPITTQLNVGAYLSGAGILTFQFTLPCPVETGGIYLGVYAGDSGNEYDIGICDQDGNLVANLGPTTLSASGRFAWLQGNVTLPPGQYFLCVAAANGSSTLQLEGFNPGYPSSHPVSATAPAAGPNIPALIAPFAGSGFGATIIAPSFGLVT
jgi:hypothetical protein